jgi:hypothetical protein
VSREEKRILIGGGVDGGDVQHQYDSGSYSGFNIEIIL